VIELADAGYTMPIQAKNIKVQGRAGQALFLAGLQGMLMGRYISEHDAKVAKWIANVMCGGDLTSPQGSERAIFTGPRARGLPVAYRGEEDAGEDSGDFDGGEAFEELMMSRQ